MNYGRYQVTKELGRGAMGVVYQARDPNLDLLVALKVLRHDRVVSEAFVRRFLSEGKALGRMDCANIVRVYNVDEDNGTVYIAMEFIEGESLNEIMNKKRFSPEEIINFGVTVAETLDYAQQKGIVHRDIKPSNFLIRQDGWIKITDFGIAHIEDSSALEQTQAGEILGTPAYMSPEQVMSRPVDGRSDLFSLGIILYELCTGIRPFGGESLAAIFKAITQDEPPPIRKYNPDIPLDLTQVIMKCLRKNPDERFETGRTLADALKNCLNKQETITSEKTSIPVKSKSISMLLLVVITLIIITGGVSYYIFTNYVSQKAVSQPTNPEPPPYKEKTGTAFLKVESMPIGAQVFLDGTFKGRTPLKLDTFIGKHEVKLTLPDYHDWEAQVELSDEGETPLSVSLVPVNGKL